MARKPKVPEQDSTPAVTDADILPESQQPEQPDISPHDAETPTPEMTAEAADKPTSLGMGEELPDPGEATDITTDIPEEVQPPYRDTVFQGQREFAEWKAPQQSEQQKQA